MPIHDWTRVNAGIFHDFHHEWISTTKHALNSGVLPADFYALAEQITSGLGPDVLTLENTGPARHPLDGNVLEADEPTAGSSGVALSTHPPKVRFTVQAERDWYVAKAKRIAIRHGSDDRVVAMIEIVSPGNKGRRHALRSFVDKAVELLDAGIHLLILDLFPPTIRDPEGVHAAIWSEISENHFELPPGQPLTLVAYSGGELKRAYIEPVAVHGALPDMPLFLESEVYVPVPLARTYDSAFESVPKRWRDEIEA